MADAGNLTVRIGAETSGLKRGLRESETGLGRLSRASVPAIKAIAAVGAAAAAAAVGVAAMTRAGMNAIDEQAKLARQLDGTIGGLRGLQLAANDAGVASGTLNSAMQRLNARLGEARSGTGAAADALSRLGLTAQQLGGMDVDERMATLADRIRDMGLSSDQAAAMLRDLGIRQGEIVNLMRQGGDAIRDATQEITDYGLAIDAVDSAAIEAANDALSRVGMVLEGVRAQLAQQLAPIILVIAERFNNAAREAGGWGAVISTAIENSIRAFGSFLDVVQRVRQGLGRIGLVMAELRLAFATFVDSAAQGFAKLIDGMINGINAVIRGMNRIPGMGGVEELGAFADSAVIEGIGQQWINAFEAAGGAREQFANLMDQPMPSERIAEFFEDVEKRRQELADSIAEDGGITGMLMGAGGEGGEGGAGAGAGGRNEEELERLRDHMQQRLDIIRESLMDEGELETNRFLDRMEQLHEAREMELIGQEEHQQLMQELAAQHQDKLTEIENRGADERAKAEKRVSDQIMSMRMAVFQQGANLLGQFAQESKAAAVAQIALNKGLAIAQIVQNTAVAQMRAMAELGPIAGPPAAAKIGVMGKIQAGIAAATGLVQAAGAMSGGGAGAGAGVARGGPGGATGGAGGGEPAGGAAFGGTLTVEGITAGALFSGDQVRELAEELLNYQRQGGEIVLA